MGIAWTPDRRADILQEGIVPSAPNSPTDGAVVVDGPAVARMFMFGVSTPLHVAKMMATRLRKGGLPCAWSVWFDIAKNMPPARAVVAASRQGVALTSSEKETIKRLQLSVLTPGHLHVKFPWELVLRDPTSKAAVWELMAKAVYDTFVSMHPQLSVEVVSANMSRVHTGDVPLPPLQGNAGYGEADILVARRVKLLSTSFSCVVSTCDYDFVLQTILARESDEVAKYLQFKNDNVDVDALRARFCDNGRGASLSAAFFLLACFKSDYSKGISGPSKTRVSTLIDLMRAAALGKYPAANVVDEETDKAGNPVLVFRPTLLAGIISKTSPVVAVNVCNILWTLAYFGQFSIVRGAGTSPPPCTPPSGFWECERFQVAVD